MNAKNDSFHEDSIQWHPLAFAFPLMEGDDWNAFKDSIKATGGNADDPVTYRMVNGVKQGLDGRQRYEACRELGVECAMRKVFLDDDKVAEFIIRKNLRRRHLDKESRQALVQAMRSEGMTQAKIATSLRVSQRTVERDSTAQNAQLPTNVGNSNLPPTVTGSDGKKYPTKKKLREPGDEKGAGGPHSGKPKIGQKKYDWKKLDTAYGNIVRLVDDLALRAYPDEKKSAEYVNCKDLLAELLKCLKHWKSLLLK